MILLLSCLVASCLVLGNGQSSASSPSSYSSSRHRLYTPLSNVFGQRPYQRVECRNPFPSRSDILPHGVVVSGRVDDVRPMEGSHVVASHSDTNSLDSSRYMAYVTVKRVLAGPRSLTRQRITVTGLGDLNRSWCHTNARKGDSWIFVLTPIGNPDFFRLNGSLIRVTLANIERMDGIVAGDAFPKFRQVTELPCEKKYCENNANCVPDESSPDGARCECATFCKPTYSPVCASNGETYNNECELRMRGCLMKKNLFVKSLNPCPYSGGSHSSSSSTTTHSSTHTTTVQRPGSSRSTVSTPGGYQRHRPSTETSDHRRPHHRNSANTHHRSSTTYTRQY